jgi:hypothetical protein
MRKRVIFAAGAAALAACGQNGGNQVANETNTQAAAPEHKHPTYCFFPDSADVKNWAAATDKDGNVVVTGEARLEDRRYMARLSDSDVSGTTASVWLTMTTNTTGMGAQENWWTVDTTVPNSTSVTELKVMCGTHLFADIQVPRKAAPATSAPKP